MTDNFWQKLNKPFFALAPMADVTDAPFRAMFAKYGKPLGGPDVMWTEFISADGLFLGGFDALEPDLMYGENERPIVAQFFSKDPKLMRRAAELAVERGFDGVDINMGCPAAIICSQGAGAAIIRNKELAKEIIKATKEGTGGKIPVSVKTRTGYSKNEIEEWVPALLEENIDALIIHARTKKEMSKVPADWSAVARAVEIRNEMGVETLIIGNGDVKSKEEGVRRGEETGCDGVMVGRGMFGNPWFFASYACAGHSGTTERPSQISLTKNTQTINNDGQKNSFAFQSRDSAEQSEWNASNKFCEICDGIIITPEMKLSVLLEHTRLYEKIFKGRKPFALMKKHFKAYVSGWDARPNVPGDARYGRGSKELRMKLMEAENADDVEQILSNYS